MTWPPEDLPGHDLVTVSPATNAIAWWWEEVRFCDRCLCEAVWVRYEDNWTPGVASWEWCDGCVNPQGRPYDFRTALPARPLTRQT